ncbi:MAG: DUF805 domain-containing protein [Candidatus Magasanikbacteria bacterium]
MNEYLNVLKNYAQFQGRSTRREYWMFILFSILILIVLTFLDYKLLNVDVLKKDGPLVSIYNILLIIPSIAVGIRRMHDVDKSGWFILIPIYNLILATTTGTKGPNRFGEDPTGSTSETTSTTNTQISEPQKDSTKK